jgi:hypothetical protein
VAPPFTTCSGQLLLRRCAGVVWLCWRRAGGLSGIMQQEGVKGLYRGLTPTLMALLPNWAVSSYGSSSRR